MADHRQAVVGEHALRAGQRGKNRLGSAAKAGEEVRLDKSGQDLDARLHVGTVDPDWMPAAGGSQGNQVGIVEAVVLEAAIGVNDIVTQHRPQLGFGLLAMGAQAVEQGDV